MVIRNGLRNILWIKNFGLMKYISSFWVKNPKKFKRYHQNFELVRRKIKEVEERDHIRNFQPPISGQEIMKTFNLKPCREIGILKEAIKEAILEGKIPNEHDASYDFMLQKGIELGLKVE